MSQSTTPFCPPNVTAADIFELGRGFAERVFCRDDGSFQLQGDLSEHRWYITIDPDCDPVAWIEEYESNDDLDQEFRGVVRGLRPILIYFNTFERTRNLIACLLRSRGDDARLIWLDTDYGWVIRGDQLLARITADASWDWRYGLEE